MCFVFCPSINPTTTNFLKRHETARSRPASGVSISIFLPALDMKNTLIAIDLHGLFAILACLMDSLLGICDVLHRLCMEINILNGYIVCKFVVDLFRFRR